MKILYDLFGQREDIIESKEDGIKFILYTLKNCKDKYKAYDVIKSVCREYFSHAINRLCFKLEYNEKGILDFIPLNKFTMNIWEKYNSLDITNYTVLVIDCCGIQK